MWQELLGCMSQRRVALCIPWRGEPIPLVYWYGVLAAVGIAVGTFYASKHLEIEGENPDTVWDALLWVLIPALLGARLWYVAQAALGGSTAFSLSRPLEILNPRTGGMNIFGAAIAGVIALVIYVRVAKVNGWALADGALMGLLIGQGIGRFGNFINIELYGPPTGSNWFGILVPETERLAQFRGLAADTRFHPTMLYEAFWLFLSFGVLYYLYRRYQSRIIRGALTGGYFVLAGVGRFIMEFWRPDQPGIPLESGVVLSFSRILSMGYVIVGIVIVLDRYGYVRIPFIERPQSISKRERWYEERQKQQRREQRARERERIRAERRRERHRRAGVGEDDEGVEQAEQAEQAPET